MKPGDRVIVVRKDHPLWSKVGVFRSVGSRGTLCVEFPPQQEDEVYLEYFEAHDVDNYTVSDQITL